MNDVLHLSIRNVGLFHSLPWLLQTLTAYTFGYTIDRCIERGHIGISNARKLAVLLSSILPATFILLATYAGCEHALVIIFFTMSIGMHGFLTSGTSPNAMDLSPNYAGALMSVVNGISSLTGVAAPYVVGLMTPNVSILYQR